MTQVTVTQTQARNLSEMFDMAFEPEEPGGPIHISVRRFDFFPDGTLGVNINGRGVRFDPSGVDPDDDVLQAILHIIDLIAKSPGAKPGETPDEARARQKRMQGQPPQPASR